MKVIEKIKEATIIQIISALFGVLILLIGSIYSEALPLILPAIIQQLPKTILLKITTLAIALSVLSIALTFVVYFKFKKNLIPKFGVLWDKNKEAYCPACQIILSEYHEQEDPPFYEFKCVKCGSYIRLMHFGKSISLVNAQTKLK